MAGLGYTCASATAGAIIRDLLAEAVIGADVMANGAIWQSMVWAVRNQGSAGVCAMAISALDVALWDLKARLLYLLVLPCWARCARRLPSTAAAASPATPWPSSRNSFAAGSSREFPGSRSGWAAIPSRIRSGCGPRWRSWRRAAFGWRCRESACAAAGRSTTSGCRRPRSVSCDALFVCCDHGFRVEYRLWDWSRAACRSFATGSPPCFLTTRLRGG